MEGPCGPVRCAEAFPGGQVGHRAKNSRSAAAIVSGLP